MKFCSKCREEFEDKFSFCPLDRALLKLKCKKQLVPTSQTEKMVFAMKSCSTCREAFDDKFSFCPVDGGPLVETNVGNPSHQALQSPIVRSGEVLDFSAVPAQPGKKATRRRRHRQSTEQGFDKEELKTWQIKADKELRKRVTLRLISLFTVSVLFSYVVILGIGSGILTLPHPITSTILAATITEGAILYRRVVVNLFPNSLRREGRGSRG